MRGHHVDCMKHKVDSPIIHEVRKTNSHEARSERKTRKSRNWAAFHCPVGYLQRGATCIVCSVLNGWSRGQKKTNNRTILSTLKNNAPAGYQGPLKTELLKGAGLFIWDVKCNFVNKLSQLIKWCSTYFTISSGSFNNPPRLSLKSNTRTRMVLADRLVEY